MLVLDYMAVLNPSEKRDDIRETRVYHPQGLKKYLTLNMCGIKWLQSH